VNVSSELGELHYCSTAYGDAIMGSNSIEELRRVRFRAGDAQKDGVRPAYRCVAALAQGLGGHCVATPAASEQGCGCKSLQQRCHGVPVGGSSAASALLASQGDTASSSCRGRQPVEHTTCGGCQKREISAAPAVPPQPAMSRCLLSLPLIQTPEPCCPQRDQGDAEPRDAAAGAGRAAAAPRHHRQRRHPRLGERSPLTSRPQDTAH
jgi:hypothetical protein